MNKKTLESLTKLFAVVANRESEDYNKQFRNIYEKFLKTEIEERYIEEQLNVFEKSLGSLSSVESRKRLSLNSVRLIGFCEDIRGTLSSIDRLVVLFHLLTLIKISGNNLDSADFTKLISDMFGLSDELLNSMYDFVNSGKGTTTLKYDDCALAELLFTEFDIVFVKTKNPDLRLNGRQLSENSLNIILKEDFLSYFEIKKYFFSDLKALHNKKEKDSEFLLQLNELELKIKDKYLVHKISLSINSGELVGVIGKSGSGKTSLLSGIAGILKSSNGSVTVSSKSELNCNRQISIVPQQDTFIPLFSVEEHLKQRCDFLQIPVENQYENIEKILLDVDLVEERSKIVSKMDSSAFQVSGGQMKRLGIAMELLVDPDILLLDEPTSGLSSEDSHRIIYLLRSLAYNNKIVVATVHQPDFDIFMMFDKVLIIDEDGYSVYFGSPALASDYLRLKAGKVDKNSLFETRFNPAILLKLLDEKDFDKSGNELTERRISPKQYYDWFRENNAVFEAKSRQVDKKKSKKQNPFLSFFNHIKFSLQVDFKHKSGLILLLAIPIIIGMGFSFLTKYSATENYTYYYNPNIPVWILILLTSSVFIGLVSSGHAFIQLRLFFRNQDRIVNKSFSNTSAVIVKYLVLSILQSLLLVTPSVMIMENSFHFVNLFLICFVLVYWGSLVGLLLSKFFKTTNIVYLTIPLVIIPQLVFSGALIHFDSFNKISQKNGGVPFIADFVPLRWASEAVIVDFCNNNPYDKQLLKNRQTLYNAVYYLDYFIPAFEEIAVISADRGKKILDNEQKKAGMVILSQDFNKQIENTKEYYAKVISKCIVIDDSIFANMENAENLKLSCSNLAIEKVINNYESGNGLEVCNEEIVRIYKPIFSLPNDTQHNKLFLSAFGEFGMCWLPKYYFNVVVLCLYNLIIILSLYFVTCVQSKKLSQ